MSTIVDSVSELKSALEVLEGLKDGRIDLRGRASVGIIMVRLPALLEEVEQMRKEAKSYAVVIHDPDAETIVESQGPVEVFSVDLGGSFDIGNPMEVDAVEALEQAAEYAKDGDGIPEGIVKQTLYGAVEQIMEAYGEFTEAVSYLSEEDRAALSDWLPKTPEVSPA